MSIAPSLLQEIRGTLSNLQGLNLTTASAGSDLFEAYVFSLVLMAARQEGASIWFESPNRSRPSQFTFRTSPGQIYWENQPPFTHAVIDFFPGRPRLTLEAHTGVYVGGKSGVIHEADIAVLFKTEAETCRRNQVPPRSSQVVLAVECKFYSTNLPLSLARGFVGLCSDLTSRDCRFALNTGSHSVEKMLTHHDKHWFNRVFPGSPKLDMMRNDFQRAFRNFKARYR